MIKEIYILHRDSGLPLNHTHIVPQEDDPDSTLFSGALQGIRSFLQECKIGDLTNFTTNENRIEVRCDIGIVVAVVADINDPPKEKLDTITEDIGSLFVSLFEKEVESFNGGLAPFRSFEEKLKEFIKLEFGEPIVGESSIVISSDTEAKNFKFNRESKSHLNLLTDWVKNRFDPTANIKNNVVVFCPPDKSLLNVDILLEGGTRRMNKLDKWLVKLIAYGGTRTVVFVIELGPTHGPAQIRQILQKIIKIGNPKYSENHEIYPFFPFEVLFIGPNAEKSSFNGLDDVIKTYKSKHVVVPEYANHIHRKHSPHHSFLRCKVSGWKWNLLPLSSDNLPNQVYP